jgi:hypothetical protein
VAVMVHEFVETTLNTNKTQILCVWLYTLYTLRRVPIKKDLAKETVLSSKYHILSTHPPDPLPPTIVLCHF